MCHSTTWIIIYHIKMSYNILYFSVTENYLLIKFRPDEFFTNTQCFLSSATSAFTNDRLKVGSDEIIKRILENEKIVMQESC